MNTSNPASTAWIPFKIPPTPNVAAGEKYSLCAKEGAISTKNPSQFLEWQQVDLPDGQNVGDILYWDGSAWVVLSAPSGSGLRVLTFESGTLAWTETEDC